MALLGAAVVTQDATPAAAFASSASITMALIPHPDVQVIAEKFATLEPVLDERARRLWAAVEAHAIGRGGISRVAEATGLSRITIRAGLKELHPHPPLDRQAVAGRTDDRGADGSPWPSTTRSSYVPWRSWSIR